jgi:hypothetical protein
MLKKAKDIMSDVMVAPIKAGLRIKRKMNEENMITKSANKRVRKKYPGIDNQSGGEMMMKERKIIKKELSNKQKEMLKRMKDA